MLETFDEAYHLKSESDTVSIELADFLFVVLCHGYVGIWCVSKRGSYPLNIEITYVVASFTFFHIFKVLDVWF